MLMRGMRPDGLQERRREQRVGDLKPAHDELAPVLDDVVAALGGTGFALSCHPADGHAWIVEHSPHIAPGGAGREALAQAGALVHEAYAGKALWAEGVAGIGDTTLLIPIVRVPTQDPLMLSVFFAGMTPAASRKADEILKQRKGFIDGFFKLWQRDRALGQRIRAMEAATDQIGTGLVLLNRNGDILFTNAAASKILDGADGMQRIRKSIGATRMSEDVTLQVALNHVIAANGGGDPGDAGPAPVVALTRREGPPLIALLLAAPLTATSRAEVAAAVYVNDPELDVAAMLAPVCRLYRLSPVEVQLVTLLAKGLPLIEAAKEMRVRELTARTYLKQIFLKTNTNRQTELVVLMLSSILRMRPPVLNSVQPLKPDGAARLDERYGALPYSPRSA